MDRDIMDEWDAVMEVGRSKRNDMSSEAAAILVLASVIKRVSDEWVERDRGRNLR